MPRSTGSGWYAALSITRSHFTPMAIVLMVTSMSFRMQMAPALFLGVSHTHGLAKELVTTA
jgi:hypothetical protein